MKSPGNAIIGIYFKITIPSNSITIDIILRFRIDGSAEGVNLTFLRYVERYGVGVRVVQSYDTIAGIVAMSLIRNSEGYLVVSNDRSGYPIQTFSCGKL